MVLGLVAALAASIVSETCFHNFAGVEVASPESARGHWCGAIAPSSGWELRGIGAVAIGGAVVALFPGPRPIRATLWVLALIALIVVPVFMTQLEYSVTI